MAALADSYVKKLKAATESHRLKSEFKEWESWYAYISERVKKVPGVSTQVRGPQRGGPFPTLTVSWDPGQVGLTAGQVGRLMLDGEPRIMTHAAGDGHSFAIRPVAMRPGDYKIVAGRLAQILGSAPKGVSKPAPAAPSVEIAGRWDVSIQYELGSAEHKLFLSSNKNKISGTHLGWALEGELTGALEGDKVEVRSALPVGGQRLEYKFSGRVTGDVMSGELSLGEYGKARWSARRHKAG